MKKLLILLLSAILCFSAVAQQKFTKNKDFKNGEKPNKEEIIEKKCKKMADKLMLDDATAAKFTPVYKNYLNELSENRDVKKWNKNDEVNDSEIDKAVQDNFAKSRKMIEVREKYYNEFRKFLTAKQTKTVIKTQFGKKLREKRLANANDSRHQSVKKRLEFNHDKQRLDKEKPSLKTE
ncbi:MAG: hypothetical protein LBC68_01520 [Prevotellaceae bacterium]|jgi:exopolysaccharide biosynthesis protein|nr:hypothetical protein [Prevotellaceae bacterium]